MRRIFGVTGWKNSGKTTLMERLVAHFVAEGLDIATLKHAHKGFDVDQPGRDSYRHRSAGARQVLVASPRRWALMEELRGAAEPGLEALLDRLSPADLVLIEGYKSAPHDKIEVIAPAGGTPPPEPIARANASVCAIAGGPAAVDLPHFSRDDIPAIAGFIRARTGLS